jgi:hypothetical protein
VLPVIVAADDIAQKASGLSLAIPTTGTAIAGSNESMDQFQGYLHGAGNSLIDFFMQIMELLGMSQTDAAQYMQNAFQSGLYQSEVSLRQGSPTPGVTATSQPKPGSFVVQTSPGSVDVFIDGQFKGTTPVDSGKVMVISDIPIGSHALELKKTGYTTIKESIQVIDGSWVVFFKEMKAEPS